MNCRVLCLISQFLWSYFFQVSQSTLLFLLFMLHFSPPASPIFNVILSGELLVLSVSFSSFPPDREEPWGVLSRQLDLGRPPPTPLTRLQRSITLRLKCLHPPREFPLRAAIIIADRRAKWVCGDLPAGCCHFQGPSVLRDLLQNHRVFFYQNESAHHFMFG